MRKTEVVRRGNLVDLGILVILNVFSWPKFWYDCVYALFGFDSWFKANVFFFHIIYHILCNNTLKYEHLKFYFGVQAPLSLSLWYISYFFLFLSEGTGIEPGTEPTTRVEKMLQKMHLNFLLAIFIFKYLDMKYDLKSLGKLARRMNCWGRDLIMIAFHALTWNCQCALAQMVLSPPCKNKLEGEVVFGCLCNFELTKKRSISWDLDCHFELPQFFSLTKLGKVQEAASNRLKTCRECSSLDWCLGYLPDLFCSLHSSIRWFCFWGQSFDGENVTVALDIYFENH